MRLDRSSQGSPRQSFAGGNSRAPSRTFASSLVASQRLSYLRRTSMARTSSSAPSSSVPSSLDRIGVGIDTARYGHRVSFLRPDRQPAAKPITVMESRAGYQALQQRLEQLHAQH